MLISTHNIKGKFRMKKIHLITAFVLGVAVTGLGLSAHEVERRPEAVCVPLYDRLPLECWTPGPGCPQPEGEK